MYSRRQTHQANNVLFYFSLRERQLIFLLLWLKFVVLSVSRVAVDMNVLGVRRALNVCKQLPHLEVRLCVCCSLP